MGTIFSPHMLGSFVVLAVHAGRETKGRKGLLSPFRSFFLLSLSSLCLFSNFLFTFFFSS